LKVACVCCFLFVEICKLGKLQMSVVDSPTSQPGVYRGLVAAEEAAAVVELEGTVKVGATQVNSKTVNGMAKEEDRATPSKTATVVREAAATIGATATPGRTLPGWVTSPASVQARTLAIAG
jgi:hypothetical protein